MRVLFLLFCLFGLTARSYSMTPVERECNEWMHQNESSAVLSEDKGNGEVDTAHDLPANDPSKINLHLKESMGQMRVAVEGVNSHINKNVTTAYHQRMELLKDEKTRDPVTDPASARLLAIHADRYVPKQENGLTFVNSDAEFKGISDRKYGYCRGNAELNRAIQVLAFYNPKAARITPQGYFDLIDAIVAGNATIIPGYANTREFTLGPEYELYMKLNVMELWKEDSVEWESIKILHQATLPATRKEINATVIDLEERLARNEFPEIVFSSLIPSRTVLGLNTDIHVVNVFRVERLENGVIRVHIWDIDFYAETLVREPKFLEITPDAKIHYAPWYEADKDYTPQSDLLSRFSITPENDAQTVQQILSLTAFRRDHPEFWYTPEELAAGTAAEELNRTLSYHPRPVKDFEYKKIGKVVRTPDDLQNLPDGEYIYGVDTMKRVVFSPRYPNLKGDTPELLATHPALVEHLAAEDGPSVRVAALGEFFILGGQWYLVNDKSGRWHGNQAHLDFGVLALNEAGAKIGPDTILKEYDKIEKEVRARMLEKGLDPEDAAASKRFRDPNHKVEEQIVEFIQTQMAHNASLLKQFIDFREVYKALATNPLYRGKGGLVDFDKILARLSDYADSQPKDFDACMGVASLYVANVGKETAVHFYPFMTIHQNPLIKKMTIQRALQLLQEIAKE